MSNKTLIIKRDGAGGVVRTTPILRRLQCPVDWFTANHNLPLLTFPEVNGISQISELRSGASYDLVISLEEDVDMLKEILSRIRARTFLGTYISSDGRLRYTADSAGWFDTTLISCFGLAKSREMKKLNRLSYQEHLFATVGARFSGERYVVPANLPPPMLTGDVAFIPSAGPTWPNKLWPWHDRCAAYFASHHICNILPRRQDLLQHLADIDGHKVIVANDSLGMHLALGLGKLCVGIFTCTSPWEIYGYDLLTKVVSSRLEEFFYDTSYNAEASRAVTFEQVSAAVERLVRL